MKVWLRLTCAAAGGIVLSASSGAWAQSRVAVLGFSGPRGGQARSALVRRLRDDYVIVDADEWQRTARRIGARGTSDRTVARVAEELAVTAVISGGMRRDRRRWRLSVSVRDGADGDVIDSVSQSVRNLGAVAGAGASISRRVRGIVDRAEGPAGGRAPPPPRQEDPPPDRDEPDDRDEDRYGGDEPDDRDEDRYGGDEPDEDRDGGSGRGDPAPPPGGYADIEEERPPMFGGRGEVARAGDEEPAGDGDGGAGSGETVRSSRRVPSKTSPWGWLDLALEVNGAQRDFTVPINADLDTGNREMARFNSSVYPEIGGRLAFYPGALFTDGWASGLGVEGSFHHHLYLKVFNRRQNQEVTSEEYTFSVGGTYRAALGTADRGVSFWARVGFGRFSFFLGDLYNDIVPPMTYDHIYVALAAYVPLGTRYAGIDLGGGYLPVLGIGAEVTAAYNGRGQAPTSHGFTFHVGASGQVYAGLRWRVGFEMLGFVTEHQGIGEGWGQEPTTVIGAGGRGIQTTGPAVDIYWRLIPQLVYRFGWSPEPGAPARGGGGDRGGDWYDSGEDRDEEPEREAEGDWDDGEW